MSSSTDFGRRRAIASYLLLVDWIAGCYRKPPDAAISARMIEVKIIDDWLRAYPVLTQFLALESIRVRNTDGEPVERLEEQREPSSYSLNLRFVPEGTDGVSAREFYSAMDARFERELGTSLSEKLFYKFIHTMRIPPYAGTVHISLGDCMGVNISTQGRVARKLDVKHYACLGIGHSGTVSDAQLNAALDRMVPGKTGTTERSLVLAQRVHDFLRQRMTRPAPAFTSVLTQEEDYMQVVLENVRSQVVPTDTWWERIEVSVCWYQEGKRWKFRIYADGQYAAGLAPPKPDSYQDLEPKYTRQLSEFASKLLNDLLLSLK